MHCTRDAQKGGRQLGQFALEPSYQGKDNTSNILLTITLPKCRIFSFLGNSRIRIFSGEHAPGPPSVLYPPETETRGFQGQANFAPSSQISWVALHCTVIDTRQDDHNFYVTAIRACHSIAKKRIKKIVKRRMGKIIKENQRKILTQKCTNV